MDFLKFTIEIALQAGELVKKYYGSDLQIETKSSYRDIVTQADKETEKLLVSLIKAKFPNHEILGEENVISALSSLSPKGTPLGLSVLSVPKGPPWGSQLSQSQRDPLGALNSYRWIIDPIDGTTNFTKNLPIFAISIALEKNGEIFIGVVYNPILNQLWFAEFGKGAFLAWARDEALGDLEKVQKIAQKLQVSNVLELKNAVLGTGFIASDESHYDSNMELFKNFGKKAKAIRRCGAASLDLCFVATGWLDGHWEFDLCPWDIAAGSLIIQESGGMLTNFDGSKLDLNKGRILATNGAIHNEMKDFLSFL